MIACHPVLPPPAMNTLTIKVPAELDQQIANASRNEQVTKSELVRRAVVAYVTRRPQRTPAFVSALDQAGDLVGCFEGGPKDLATNPKYMKGFGKV
jgi:carbohydrate-binding DOMON domain-containing protein